VRDDFPEPTKRRLGQRVGLYCSNPECRVSTAGPTLAATDAVNLGVAAHITAASPDGPRFDASLKPEERSDIGNAIWLCQTCAKLIDSDIHRFTIEVLRSWKGGAEGEALAALGKPVIASRNGLAETERARLLDERVERVVQDFKVRGEPRTIIESFSDLTRSEKADVYERAYRVKKGRTPESNPYL
jgi:hypothetical protein